MNKMENKRIYSYDYMKALAIFCVVLGHLLERSDSPDNSVRIFIYSFHMPVFFLISGLLAYGKKSNVGELWSWYKKKTKILLPLFFFSIGNIFLLHEPYCEAISWGKFGLWFLWVLFLFDSIYAMTQLLLLKNRNKVVEIVVLMISVWGCFILRKYENSLVGEIFNFKQMYNYVFFVLGVLIMRIRLHKYIFDERIQLFFIVIYILGLSSGLGVLNVPMKISAVLVIFFIFEKLSGIAKRIVYGGVNTLILKVGQKTLFIYVLHYYFIQGNLLFINNLLFSSPCLYLPAYSISAVFIILMCVGIEEAINTNSYIRKYIFGNSK